MNTDLMLRVADAIEAHPRKFDMRSWYTSERFTPTPSTVPSLLEPDCGTAGCIGGWGMAIEHPGEPYEFEGFLPRVANLFGLSNYAADALFCSFEYGQHDEKDENAKNWWVENGFLEFDEETGDVNYSVSPEDAASALRQIVAGDLTLPEG